MMIFLSQPRKVRCCKRMLQFYFGYYKQLIQRNYVNGLNIFNTGRCEKYNKPNKISIVGFTFLRNNKCNIRFTAIEC